MKIQLQHSSHLLAYQSLIRRLRLLIERVSANEPDVLLLALFGSVARFEPGPYSDADVLIILDKPRPYKYPENLGIIGTIVDVENEHGLDWNDWPISVVISEEQGNDLDEDFLACVQRDGVLLYQREGSECPSALQGMLSFDEWMKRGGIARADLAFSGEAPTNNT